MKLEYVVALAMSASVWMSGIAGLQTLRIPPQRLLRRP